MQIIAFILILLMVLSALRVVIGPTLWDRLLGFNLIASKLVMLVILVASIKGTSLYLDIALIFALFGFIGVVYFTKFLSWKEDK
ncbi:monovalent cation/H+ antiporter complex subunit F [Fusibacter sp. JL216-2]|uniref:monovalent cation/H+ antiporter complex subunit F n=1 Tax=Fusibacter sp. JL216-2 TaxID=3071453 RepID=UPI003D331B03